VALIVLLWHVASERKKPTSSKKYPVSEIDGTNLTLVIKISKIFARLAAVFPSVP